MKGLKLKPIYLNEGEILISPPDCMSLQPPPKPFCTMTNDLAKVRELIRGRTFRKANTTIVEDERDLVDNLSQFKPANELAKGALSPLMRRNTFRRLVTIRNGQTVSLTKEAAISLQAVPVESHRRRSRIGTLFDQVKTLKSKAKAVQAKDSQLNRQYETYQREKYAQYERELHHGKPIINQIKAEVAAAKTKIEELTSQYNREVGVLYMQEAKAVHMRNQSKGSKNIGEEDKHFIERERIRKIIQEKHQEHFKEKRVAEKELEVALKRLEEAHSMKRTLQKGFQEVRTNLVTLYCNILREGLDLREGGIRWAIKELWKMNEPVPIKSFPKYLDDNSILFLLQVSTREIDLTSKEEQLTHVKTTIRKNRPVTSTKQTPRELLTSVRSRIREISKSVVVGRPMTAEGNYQSKQLTLFSSPGNVQRAQLHTRMNVLKADIAACQKEITALSTAEIKRVAADYHAATTKPEKDLVFIVESLVGARLNEFKKLLVPSHI